MADVEKVSIALTTEQIASLKSVVETGEYATTSEVVREAVRDWQVKRELRQTEIQRLRQLWDEGVSGGSVGLQDMTALRNEARRRLQDKKSAG